MKELVNVGGWVGEWVNCWKARWMDDSRWMDG